MTQFGNQNQDGQVTDYSAAITDDVAHSSSEGSYATLPELIDYTDPSAYGNPDVPADALIEHAGRFYTALPIDAFKRAGTSRSRSHTYALSSSTAASAFVPVQILRKNPGRRVATVRIVWTNATPVVSTPVFWSQRASDLQSLSSVTGAVSSPGALSGPWEMADLLVPPIVFKWYGTGDLFALSPFADGSVHAVYASVTEHFDA